MAAKGGMLGLLLPSDERDREKDKNYGSRDHQGADFSFHFILFKFIPKLIFFTDINELPPVILSAKLFHSDNL